MKVIDKLHIPEDYDCRDCNHLDSDAHCKATGNNGQKFSLFPNSYFDNYPLQLSSLRDNQNGRSLTFIFHMCYHYKLKD